MDEADKMDEYLAAYAQLLLDSIAAQMRPPLVSPLRLVYDAEPILPGRS